MFCLKIILATSLLSGVIIITGCSSESPVAENTSSSQLTSSSVTPIATIATQTVTPESSVTPSVTSTTHSSESNDVALKTIQNNSVGVFLGIPSNWQEIESKDGFRARGEHGDLWVTHFNESAQNIGEFAENFIIANTQYFENERQMKDMKLISVGFLGQGYGKLIFFPNGIGEIGLISLKANPDYLDEYLKIFNAIELSLGIKQVSQVAPTSTATSTAAPTPTATSTAAPTPTATASPEPAYINVNGDLIPALTQAGSDTCDPRFLETAFCIEVLAYTGITTGHIQKAVDGLSAIVGRYPVTMSELKVDWPNFGPGGGYQNYLGIVLWHVEQSQKDLVIADLCSFKMVAAGYNVRIDASKCSVRQSEALEGTVLGGAIQGAGNMRDNGYSILAANSMLDEVIKPVTSPASQTFNDPRKVMAHEYFHSYQTSHVVRRRGGSDGVPLDQVANVGPVWLMEGAAEYAAIRVSSLEGWTDWNAQMRARMDVSLRELANYPDLSIEDNATRAQKVDNASLSPGVGHALTYELAVWAVAYAISISTHDDVMVKYWDDLEAHGYEQSFERNVGVSLKEFYQKFEVFRGKTIDDQMSVVTAQINN
jgi:hypothetical protein